MKSGPEDLLPLAKIMQTDMRLIFASLAQYFQDFMEIVQPYGVKK